MVATTEKLVAEETLLSLDEDARVEVIDGEMVEMAPVGGLHHIIAGNILRKLDTFVLVNKLGLVFMDGLIYLLARQGRGLRGALVPDVSFVRKTDIPRRWDRKKPFPGAPTLAVEVVSPGDDGAKLLKKVRTYLEAGTQQVWVVYPEQAEIHQYRADTLDVVRVYRGEDEIDAAALLPGLKLVASEFFVVPDLEA